MIFIFALSLLALAQDPAAEEPPAEPQEPVEEPAPTALPPTVEAELQALQVLLEQVETDEHPEPQPAEEP